MGAAVVILIVAGFTTYTLLSPALGVVLWVTALLGGVASLVLRIAGKRSQKRSADLER